MLKQYIKVGSLVTLSLQVAIKSNGTSLHLAESNHVKKGVRIPLGPVESTIITMKDKVAIRKNIVTCDHKLVKLAFGPTVPEEDQLL